MQSHRELKHADLLYHSEYKRMKIVVSLKKKKKKESQRRNLTIATVEGSNVECNNI